MITIPALKRIKLKDLQKKYPWIEEIESDTSTEKAVTLNIRMFGNYATGKEIEALESNLGVQHMLWVVEHQDELPELLATAKKEEWWYLFFPATIVVRRDGNRYVPYCFSVGGRWGGNWFWLVGRFGSGGRVAFGQVAPENLGTLDPLNLSALEKIERRVSTLEAFKEKIEKVIRK